MAYSSYDKKHIENILAYMRGTARSFDQMAEKVARLYASLPQDEVFDISRHPELKNQIDKILRRLAHDTQENIVNGINNEWSLSNNKNDEVLEGLLKGNTLPERLDKKWRGRNIPALEAFRKRKINGIGLSDRVWKIVKGEAVNIERNLAIGIHDGKSASDLAGDIKKHLRNPDALFRRVRDVDGDLKLSRAARQYHPGRGVYRSAYKNALRVTRTETNIAYQRADNERWKQQDFVLGVEVQRSNTPYDCDICAAGVGRYPKDYEWSSFHPNCRCRAVPILASEKEFMESVTAAFDDKEYKFDGYVEDIPGSFKELQQKTSYEHFGH